jgi:hypothetical protein
MLATVVTSSVNAAQLCALIAAILFIIAFAAGLFTRAGTPNASYNYVGGWIVIAGFIFVALALLWGLPG